MKSLQFVWIWLWCLSVLSMFSVDHNWINVNGHLGKSISAIPRFVQFGWLWVLRIKMKPCYRGTTCISGILEDLQRLWLLKIQIYCHIDFPATSWRVQKSFINPYWQVDSFTSLPYISKDPGRWEVCIHAKTNTNLWKDVGLKRCEWHVPTVEGRVSNVQMRDQTM